MYHFSRYPFDIESYYMTIIFKCQHFVYRFTSFKHFNPFKLEKTYIKDKNIDNGFRAIIQFDLF